MKLTMRLMWWGYLHSNGQHQVKRWFGDVKDYTDDCRDNPFVVFVVNPFAADNYEMAEKHIIEAIEKSGVI